MVPLPVVVNVEPTGNPVEVTNMFCPSGSVGLMLMEKAPASEQISKCVLSVIVPAVAVL